MTMDINDEVRFRVSPDIIGSDNTHSKLKNRATKVANRPNRPKINTIREKTDQNGASRRKNSEAPASRGYRFQAVVNQDGLIELDLSSRKLRTIPEEVLRLARVEVFIVSHNELRSFPSQVSVLHRLKHLDASWNSLLALPETFTNLKHLKQLNLSHNALHTLPANIHALLHLRTLNLDYNKIDTLPHQIGFLPVLRSLSVCGNQLWHLPKTISKLSKLRQLNLGENLFDQFPAVVCQLCDLESLDFHGNNMVNLPAEFEHMQKLREVNLSGNQLESVPYILSQVRHLRSLNLSNNRIIGIPPRLHKLTKLKALDLQKNLLKSLPILPSLEYLNVAENRLRILSLSKNRHLKQVNASGNSLEDMPLGIYNQKHLQVLKLARNHIGYVSQDVTLLQKLSHLDLSYNELRSLPQVIHELENLQTFNMKGNPIERRGGARIHTQNMGPRSIYQQNTARGIGRSKSMDRMRSRSVDRLRDRRSLYHSNANLARYGSDSQLHYDDFEDGPPKHYNKNFKSIESLGNAAEPRIVWQNYKRPRRSAKEVKTGRSWFKWGRKQKQRPQQSWPDTKTFGTQYTQVSQDGRADSTRTRGALTSSTYNNIHQLSGKTSTGVQNYSHPHTLPLQNGTPSASRRHHKGVAEINYPLNVLDGKSYLDTTGGLDKSFYHNQKSTIGLSSRITPRSFDSRPLKQPSYSTIPMVTTHRDSTSDCSSNAAATVAEWESVGDELSLGEEDYEYQPTSVEDRRLRGVADSVERLLNKQLLKPVTQGKHTQGKGNTSFRPVEYTSKNISARVPRHCYAYTSDGNASIYSLPETRTSLLHTEPDRLVPRKQDIIMKSPFERDWNKMSTKHHRRSTVYFTVTPGGGTFDCEADRNISVHFPVGAIEFPVECQLQVTPVSTSAVERVQASRHSRLHSLISIATAVVTVRCAEPVTLNIPISLTVPEPPGDTSGHLHLVNYHNDGSCTPCTGKRSRGHGYATVDTWDFSGKCTVLTKSRDPLLASSTVEKLLQLIDWG